MVERLIQLLEEANDLGHNMESQFDRELLAHWLISHGIIVEEDDHEKVHFDRS